MNPNNLRYERRHNEKRNNGRHKVRRASRKPTYFSYNFQRLPHPSNNVGIIDTLSDSDKDKKEEIIEKAFSKTITKEKPSYDNEKIHEGSARDDYDEIIEELESLLKETENVEKRMLRLRRDEMESELNKPLEGESQQRNPVGYIDYSNSQMPFNEGQSVKSKVSIIIFY